LMIGLLAACLPSTNPPVPNATTVPLVVTIQSPIQTLAPTPAPSADASGTTNLVVWMHDEFAQAPSVSGGRALSTAIVSFETTFPATRVTILPKKPYGKGGIEDLLIATQAALPQAMPDVVTLDVRELPRYVKEGLVQPFDSQFAPTLQADLYPFARQAELSDGRVYAIPFTTDLLQLSYDSALLRAPPLTWTELLSSNVKYAFALAEDNGLVGDSFLAQYVALGGHFSDARGKPSLDRIPLRDALEFYRAMFAQNVAVTNTLALKNEDDAWRLYLANKVALVDTNTRIFLRDRAQLKSGGYGAIPTRDGNLATLSRSWGFAIVTGDPTRRIAAQRFVEWLISADTNAAWNRAAGRAPVRKGAISAWSSDFNYREFVHSLLSVAVNHPTVAPVAGPSAAQTGATVDSVLQMALADVLTNNVSPLDAADKAIAALTR
ncbi:MAG: extracellular solute-binding protein, partial [Chloroflexota bacterium]